MLWRGFTPGGCQEAAVPRWGRERGRAGQQQEYVNSTCRATPALGAQLKLPHRHLWGTDCSSSLSPLLLPPPEASNVLTDSFGSCGAAGDANTGEDVLCSQLLLGCTSATLMQSNYKTDEVGRDFWRSSSPTSLLKGAVLESLFYLGFEGWRFHNLPGHLSQCSTFGVKA